MTKPKWLPAWFIATGLILASLAASTTAAWAAPACIGPASDMWINLTINKVRNSNGLITATLYSDDPKKFLVRHGSMYVASTPATVGQTKFCLFVPKAGTYAIAVYHDEDSSGKINRGGLFGIPTEAVGFSNNPTILFGPPSLRSVKIEIVQPNQSAAINLKRY